MSGSIIFFGPEPSQLWGTMRYPLWQFLQWPKTNGRFGLQAEEVQFVPDVKVKSCSTGSDK